MKFKEGIYLVNKPKGKSSFWVVNQIRKRSGIKKVGHAGTLDPLAEGLLIVLVGKEFTKKADQFSKLDKVYEFELKLGEESTTGDSEGEIKKISSNKPSKDEIINVLDQFIGEITQTPPIYSAKKVGGQRAYKLARKGEKPDLKPQKVTIKNLDLVSYEYPSLILKADVSSGTYIRTLGEDIGKELKTGAYCIKIVRTQIGSYILEDSISIDQKG